MRHLGLFFARVVFGSYLAVHGAQKLFGSFKGSGLDKAGLGFEKKGLRPGKALAAIAGACELGGGVLTATGIAAPLGPIIIASTMAVASTTHRENGALARDGGFELPLTNMAMAIALMSAGTGALRLGPRLSKRWTLVAFLGSSVLAAGAVAHMLSNSTHPAADADLPASEPDVVNVNHAMASS
ncbi:MAG: DoxX family protein [Acidimicrobiales bacterium]